MGLAEARVKLSLAKKQLGRVRAAISDLKDPEEAVTWAFYAYENAVVAAAEAAGLPWKKTHPSKAEVAGSLHKRGMVSLDVGGRIARLNELRKDVQYGESGPSIEEIDLEALTTELERFIQEVERLVESGAQNA